MKIYMVSLLHRATINNSHIRFVCGIVLFNASCKPLQEKKTITIILYCINVFILMKIYPVMNVRSLLEMVCTLV